MYRLHLDVPLGEDQEEAIRVSRAIIKDVQRGITENTASFDNMFTKTPIEVNARLGNDASRYRSNFLDINENGHASNKKTKVL